MEEVMRAAWEGNGAEVLRLLDADPTLLEMVDPSDGNTPLTKAAEKGQLGVVRLLIQRGAGVNARGRQCMTALHCAVEGGHHEIVAFLLNKGAEPGIGDQWGRTPLILGCEKGHLGLVQLLVQQTKGQGLDDTDRLGKSGLYYAAQRGHGEVVAFLLSQGAQASRRSDSGETILMAALSGREIGALGVIQMLLSHLGEETLEETDSGGWTALHRAAVAGRGEVVIFLLSKGAQASSRAYNGAMPITLACSHGHLGIVQILLQHLGDEGLEHMDERGCTALYYAVRYGHEGVVNFLLSMGARADITNHHGETPLMEACSATNSHLGIVQILLQPLGGKGVKDIDGEGRTVLHHARGDGKLVKLLLGMGANANTQDHKGITALMDASGRGCMRAVRLLVRHAGKEGLEFRDARGWTALHFAAAEQHRRVVRFLLLSGANFNVRTYNGSWPHDLALAPEENEDEEEDNWYLFDERKQERRARCAAVFDWWEGELERHCLLYRATCLNKAHATQRDMPTSQVPTYLEARVAAGHALPSVEVGSPEVRNQQKRQAGASGKRKAVGGGDDARKAEANEEELRAVLTYVVNTLNEELVTELLEGFHEDQGEEEEEDEDEEEEEEYEEWDEGEDDM